jgi:hypothetical protein
MTLYTPIPRDFTPVHEPIQRARRGRTRTRIEALAVGVCVATGFGASMVALPSFETPASVTRTFIDATFTKDWPAAWALLCDIGRDAHGDFGAFSERLTYAHEYLMNPSDVDVEIGEIDGVDQAKSRGVAVEYTVTSDARNREDWDVRGEALVVQEDGRFRVCTAGS